MTANNVTNNHPFDQACDAIVVLMGAFQRTSDLMQQTRKGMTEENFVERATLLDAWGAIAAPVLGRMEMDVSLLNACLEQAI